MVGELGALRVLEGWRASGTVHALHELIVFCFWMSRFLVGLARLLSSGEERVRVDRRPKRSSRVWQLPKKVNVKRREQKKGDAPTSCDKGPASELEVVSESKHACPKHWNVCVLSRVVFGGRRPHAGLGESFEMICERIGSFIWANRSAWAEEPWTRPAGHLHLK